MSTPTALVTGASRGIGRAVALRLAGRGYGLTVSSRRLGDLESLTPLLPGAGSPAVATSAVDLAEPGAGAALAAAHEERFGTMSALVVNAGVGTAGPLADLPARRLAKTLQVNFASAVDLVQAALPQLRAGADLDPERGATVVALSSITGVYAEAGLAAYGATKAALASYVDTLNLEESGRGVTACSIAPGYVATDMSAWTTDTVPAETMIPVADVVAAVDFALSLSRRSLVTRLVMTRAGAGLYEA